jgi:hypothetical protein
MDCFMTTWCIIKTNHEISLNNVFNTSITCQLPYWIILMYIVLGDTKQTIQKLYMISLIFIMLAQ